MLLDLEQAVPWKKHMNERFVVVIVNNSEWMLEWMNVCWTQWSDDVGCKCTF